MLAVGYIVKNIFLHQDLQNQKRIFATVTQYGPGCFKATKALANPKKHAKITNHLRRRMLSHIKPVSHVAVL